MDFNRPRQRPSDKRNYFHFIRKRLITIGIKPKDARHIALKFAKQCDSQGQYNALDYFKRVGDCLINVISKKRGVNGKPPVTQWVKTTHCGFPVFLSEIREYPVEILLRVAKFARAIFVDNPTRGTIKKLRDAVVEPYKGTPQGESDLHQLVLKGLNELRKRFGFALVKKFDYSYTSVISSARTYVSKSVPTGTAVGLDFDILLSTFNTWREQITSLPNWEELIYPVHPFYMCRKSFQAPVDIYAGQLGGVMEQGGKLRIFAAPNILLQNAMEPLQNHLDSIRNLLPWDCFKSQESGAQWAQDKMNEDFIISSIDLSSATCRFPFEPQLLLLKELSIPEDQIDLYRRVSKGLWKVQPHIAEFFGESISWRVGQPLGTNPSMSTFAFTHGLLLAGICVELGFDIYDTFRILGDDVVISQTSVANRYRSLINSIGVAISEHKSYVSAYYAEFAGFSITRECMVRPGKWKLATKRNISGLVKDLGGSVIDELREDHRFIVRLMSFIDGIYNPPVDQWSQWLYLRHQLSSVLSVDPLQVTVRTKEISWFDGATSWLSKRYPDMFFDEDKSGVFLECLPPHPAVKAAMELCGSTLSWNLITTQVIYVEHFAREMMGFTELMEFIKTLTEHYERFLWSIPATRNRILNDRYASIENAYREVTKMSGF